MSLERTDGHGYPGPVRRCLRRATVSAPRFPSELESRLAIEMNRPHRLLQALPPSGSVLAEQMAEAAVLPTISARMWDRMGFRDPSRGRVAGYGRPGRPGSAGIGAGTVRPEGPDSGEGEGRVQ